MCNSYLFAKHPCILLREYDKTVEKQEKQLLLYGYLPASIEVLKFGTAIKVGSSNEFSYYCPDKKVWEETGYFNKEQMKMHLK